MSQAKSSASVSSGTRQKKRARVSEAAEYLSDATRSKKYWFDDGNIILHVESMLFRLHRGVLSRHSPRFNEMFPASDPDQKMQPNTLHGCQVVDLHGDKKEDWDGLLAVIYDRDSSYRPQEKFPVDMVCSSLRLGKKYGFKAIFHEAMERIRRVIPTRVEKWAGLPDELCGSLTTLYRLTKVVFETGNQTLLPSLFLFCSVYPKDGASAIFSLAEKVDLPQPTQQLVVGREKLMAACLEFHFAWAMSQPVSNNQHTCNQPYTCGPLKQNYFCQLLVKKQKLYLAFTSGSGLLKAFGRGSLCKACRDRIVSEQDANRKVMWDKLPSFFGLPEWKDLKDA